MLKLSNDQSPQSLAATEKGQALPVIRREIEEVLAMPIRQVVSEVESLYAEVNQSARNIIGSAGVSALGEASGLLVVMDGKLQKLKTSENLFAKWFHEKLRMTKTFIKMEIKKRQSIKTALEESSAYYRTKRDALLQNIDEIKAGGLAAMQTDGKIDVAIEQLKSDIAVLEAALRDGELGDGDRPRQINTALMSRRTLLGDLAGAKVINKESVVDMYMQLSEREQLYIRIGSILPVLDTLTSQQLARLISRIPIRSAADAIETARKSLNALIRQSSEHMLEDSLNTAEIVNAPLVDDDIINLVVTNIGKMIDGCRSIIDDAKTANQRLLVTARQASDDIDAKMRAFQQQC